MPSCCVAIWVWLHHFRRRTAWNDRANRRRYDAPPDPWGFVSVDPSTVRRFRTLSLEWGLDRVQGGEWDHPDECRSLDGMYIQEGLAQRFEGNRDWAETVYYETVTDRIAENGNFRNYRSVETFEMEFLPAVDALYEDMRENGYRPNLGVVYSGPEDADYIHDLEPMALIGRDGEFVWTEGYHRLILAQLLDIDAIPVYILQRHENWQRVRDRVAVSTERATDFEGGSTHPDLRDVTDR